MIPYCHECHKYIYATSQNHYLVYILTHTQNVPTHELTHAHTHKKTYISKSVDMWSVGLVMYILLGGRHPFYESNTTKMFIRIAAADFVFGDNWTNTTEEAKVREGKQTVKLQQ